MKYNKTPFSNIKESGRQFPGSYSISEITLTNAKGKHDVKDIVSEIVVYESIDMPFIFGEIHFQDIYGTILHSRLMGNEILEFRIDDGNLYTNLKFQCYSITDRKRTNPQSEMFKMNFMGFEGFQSQFRKISKSYINMKAEDIIRDMFLVSTTSELSERKFYFEPSLSDLCCVIPNWDLSRACNFIAGRTLSREEDLQANTYKFFQTIDGLYNFFPLEGLLDRERNVPYSNLIYDPLRKKGNGQDNLENVAYDQSSRTRSISLENLTIMDGIDYLENINNGMFGNKTSVIDITQREIKDEDFDYLKDFDDIDGSKHLGKHTNDGRSYPLVYEGSRITRNPYNAWFPIHKSKGLFTEETDSHEWYNTTLPKRFSKSRQIDNMKMNAVMPGHLGLMSGHIVNLIIPDGSNPYFRGKGSSEIDEYISGEYLVSNVTRRFTVKNFEMNIELCRDSLTKNVTH